MTSRSIAKNLKILFCGSDGFSAVSLARLHGMLNKSDANSNLISSITVACKKDKPSGRGLKDVRENPTKTFATENELELVEIEDFKRSISKVPTNIDLIIAVSFGLFIPLQLMSKAQYGGINVHPSLLPRHRGASPIQHALLARDRYTGVTVQAMDNPKFDHGTILSQSEHVDINKVISETPYMHEDESLREVERNPYALLWHRLAHVGAELLATTIQRGLFVPPYTPYESPHRSEPEYEPSDAPKIKNLDSQLNFALMTVREAVTWSWINHSVFCYRHDIKSGKKVRILLSKISSLEVIWPGTGKGLEAGTYYSLRALKLEVRKVGGEVKTDGAAKDGMAIKLVDGWILVQTVQMESKAPMSAEEWVSAVDRDRFSLVNDLTSWPKR